MLVVESCMGMAKRKRERGLSTWYRISLSFFYFCIYETSISSSGPPTRANSKTESKF